MRIQMTHTVSMPVDSATIKLEITVERDGERWLYVDRMTGRQYEGSLDDILEAVKLDRQGKLSMKLKGIRDVLRKGGTLPKSQGACLPLSYDSGKPAALVCCVHSSGVYSVQIFGVPAWLSRPFLANDLESICLRIDGTRQTMNAAPDLEQAFEEFKKQ